MGSIHHMAPLAVSAEVAWDFLELYSRAEVHVFSSCVAERVEDDHRVVTMADGREIWERNVTVDPVHRRTSYTMTGLHRSDHHHAEMRIDVDPEGRATLVWVTDYLPPRSPRTGPRSTPACSASSWLRSTRTAAKAPASSPPSVDADQ